MKLRIITTLVFLIINASAWADLPTLEQAGKGTAGAAAGGLIGSRVGQGSGKTATTATGAAIGAVAASGCKPTWLSAVGATIGGLVGSQLGNGNGKNVMAGTGAAIGAVAGSDCSEDEKVASNHYTPMIGHAVQINGMNLKEVAPEQFPSGKFQGFPRIQQKSDFDALDALSRDYAKASWDAAAAGDWESFAVNRHLGMRLVEFRLHYKMAALDFVSSLSSSKTGTGTLAPGATVFLPAFNRWEEQQLSAVDYQRNILSANFDSIDWQAAPKTADLNGFLRSAANLVGGNKPASGGIGPVANHPQQAGDMLKQLPVGAVFSAHDEAGNQFLVERTAEGYNVGNPSGRPVSVPLTKLGFMPDMPPASDAQIKVAPLVKRMQMVRQELFWQSLQAIRVGAISTMQAPNRIIIQNTPVRGELDQDGNLATDALSSLSGATAYKSNPSYRAAFELADFIKHRDTQFELGCYAMNDVRAYETTFLGQSAEILRHECLNQNKQAIRVRDYYVLNGKKLQTAESLLQDKAVAEKLKNVDTMRNLAEAVMNFVPLIGNVDAGAKCLTGTSITSSLGKHLNNKTEQYRPFVSDLLPSPSDESVIEQGLNCASAIPVAGLALKGASKAGSAVGLFRDWSGSEQAKTVLKGLDFFDARVVGNAAQFDNLAGLSGQSVGVLKGFYDRLQLFANSSQTIGAFGS